MAYRIGGYRLRRFLRADLIKSINNHSCLCETLRCIYDEIHEMKDKKKKEVITEHLVDGMVFAKKMADRLYYYKDKYKDETGSSGASLEIIPDSRARLKMRKAR